MWNRRLNIDYLRVTACLMVIFLHLSTQFWHVTDVQTGEWAIYNLYDCIVRSAVPLFFMISGMLFLEKNKIPPLKVLFKKNILKIFVIYVFWSYLYAVDSVGLNNFLNLKKVLYYMVYPKYHLWYLPVLIAMYLILPVFWTIVKYEDGKYLKYVCTMFFLFAIVKQTFNQIPLLDYPFNEYFDSFNFAFTGYTGYYLFGYVLDHYKDYFKKIPTSVLFFLFIALVLTASELNLLYARSIVKPTTLFYKNNVFVFFEALTLFMIFLRLPRIQMFEKYPSFVLKVSKNTLFVYLFHVFVIEKLNMYFHVNVLSVTPIISIPVLTLIIFFICQIVAEILNKIPLINKWLL